MGIGMCIEERKRHCYDSNELFGSKVLNLQNKNKNINFKQFRDCYTKNIDIIKLALPILYSLGIFLCI